MFKSVTYFETKDYALFNLLTFNRPIDKTHVKTLVESMRLHGFKGVIQVIKTKFIDGVERYYVVDGQHRIAAAKQLGLGVRFELTELNTRQETAEFIAQLNTSAKSWGTANFLAVWSALDVPEYVKLNKIQKDTGFQITPLLEAYLYTSCQVSYRKGVMKFANESESDKIVSQMTDLNQYLPNKAFCRRAIVRVMRNPKYNHKKMLGAIKQYIQLVGSFTENERGLKAELDKLVLQNC